MFWFSRLLYQNQFFFLSIHDTDENHGAASSSRSCVLVAVVDATNLRMNLRLVLELQRLGRPMLVARNMADVARARGWVRPEVTTGAELLIEAGRHPVLEEQEPPKSNRQLLPPQKLLPAPQEIWPSCLHPFFPFPKLLPVTHHHHRCC